MARYPAKRIEEFKTCQSSTNIHGMVRTPGFGSFSEVLPDLFLGGGGLQILFNLISKRLFLVAKWMYYLASRGVQVSSSTKNG